MGEEGSGVGATVALDAPAGGRAVLRPQMRGSASTVGEGRRPSQRPMRPQHPVRDTATPSAPPREGAGEVDASGIEGRAEERIDAERPGSRRRSRRGRGGRRRRNGDVDDGRGRPRPEPASRQEERRRRRRTPAAETTSTGRAGGQEVSPLRRMDAQRVRTTDGRG